MSLINHIHIQKKGRLWYLQWPTKLVKEIQWAKGEHSISYLPYPKFIRKVNVFAVYPAHVQSITFSLTLH